MVWEIMLPDIFILHMSHLKPEEDKELHGDSVMGDYLSCHHLLFVTVRKT